MKIRTIKQFEVECSECGYNEYNDQGNFDNATQYSIWLKDAGWRMRKGENICPDCAVKYSRTPA